MPSSRTSIAAWQRNSGSLSVRQREILDVIDDGLLAATFPDDGDDIEAKGTVYPTVVDVVVDGTAQIPLLLIVDGL